MSGGHRAPRQCDGASTNGRLFYHPHPDSAMVDPYRRSFHSMAALVPGTRAEIRYIAFRGIREACHEAGVREGDVVVCRSNGDDLLLEIPDRGTVALDGSWARFIEVDVRSPGLGAAPPMGIA